MTWAAFSPDGRLIVTATGHPRGGLGRGEARVWEVETGQPISPPLRHRIDLSCAAFSPDGLHIITADQGGTARIWDAATWQHRPDLAHDDSITSVAFSPDGRHAVTLGGTAKVWMPGTVACSTPWMPGDSTGTRSSAPTATCW